MSTSSTCDIDRQTKSIEKMLKKEACDIPDGTCTSSTIWLHASNLVWWFTLITGATFLGVILYYYALLHNESGSHQSYIGNKTSWSPDTKIFGALNVVLFIFDTYVTYMESLYSGVGFEYPVVYLLELILTQGLQTFIAYGVYTENYRIVMPSLILWLGRLSFSVLRHWYISKYTAYLRMVEIAVVAVEMAFVGEYDNVALFPHTDPPP